MFRSCEFTLIHFLYTRNVTFSIFSAFVWINNTNLCIIFLKTIQIFSGVLIAGFFYTFCMFFLEKLTFLRFKIANSFAFSMCYLFKKHGKYDYFILKRDYFIIE